MILEARERNCLSEVLVIASALSGQDVRDRPMEQAQAADEKHKKFDDEQLGVHGLPQAVEVARRCRAAGSPKASTSTPRRSRRAPPRGASAHARHGGAQADSLAAPRRPTS